MEQESSSSQWGGNWLVSALSSVWKESKLPCLRQLQLWCREATGPQRQLTLKPVRGNQVNRTQVYSRSGLCRLHTHFPIDLHCGANITSENSDSYFRVSLSSQGGWSLTLQEAVGHRDKVMRVYRISEVYSIALNEPKAKLCIWDIKMIVEIVEIAFPENESYSGFYVDKCISYRKQWLNVRLVNVALLVCFIENSKKSYFMP